MNLDDLLRAEDRVTAAADDLCAVFAKYPRPVLRTLATAERYRAMTLDEKLAKIAVALGGA